MFIWDFVADTVLGQITDWVYGQIVGFLGSFFAQMGNMGADLFEMEWVQAIVMFFSCLAWALYVTGLVVAGFECGIEYLNGRGSIRETGVNALKGFFAASLVSTVPVELYRLCVSLQASLTRGLSGSGETFGEAAQRILSSLKDAGTWQEAAVSGVFGGISAVDSPILMIFLLILMGYADIKVFFAKLKRGGNLLIQISVGSLYLFSVPRGYTDGFISWCKQVVGLCLTAFLQAVILTEGPKMLRTPTYHVFHMYKYHQDADLVESYIDGVEQIGEDEKFKVPNLQESASVDKDGVVTITLNNLSIDKAEEVEIAFAECDPKHVTAAILTNDMHAYNTFEDPDKVHEEVFTEYKIADGRITFTMPACSVVMFRIK